MSGTALPARKVHTQDGRTIDLQCPVCGSGAFATSGPDDRGDLAGFQHVIVGINEEAKRQLVLPVKFAYCTNCGFVMKFMIERKGRNKTMNAFCEDWKDFQPIEVVEVRTVRFRSLKYWSLAGFLILLCA